MKEYKPYCYLIGWSKLNVWYYGSEYSNRTKIANPTNLWTTYFTSSKIVKEFRKIHGEPDILEIRKIATTAEETIFWEYRVLRKLKVRALSKWLNINEGKAPVGIEWPQDRKLARSTALRGSGNPMFGKTHSLHTRQLISERSAKKGSENGMFGKKHSAEARLKMSSNRKPNPDRVFQSVVHKFIHDTFGCIELSIPDMIKKYPGLGSPGLRALKRGALKTYKGWTLCKD